uniref:5'-Nucleotidase C-terminal domain-containing protein n=1 Tax=Tetranychus urticae TaxID=32264 RepID=T1KNP1_TETUR
MIMFSSTKSDEITILHFNDVYNVDEHNVEPIGGAARFVSALQSTRTQSTLTLFSGDCLGPSLLSTFTKGSQMVPVLNSCQVDCAVVGNHDFDYGIDALSRIIQQTHFPWLLSNVTSLTGNTIAGTKIYHIIEVHGKKFGIIGLVENEWFSILSTVNQNIIIYKDFALVGQKLAAYLKYKKNVDYVIALTHMRNPNDIRLAKKVPEIDLILGGHDHICQSIKVDHKRINSSTFIIKSGTDFKNFSKISLQLTDKTKPFAARTRLTHEIIDVTSNFTVDSQLKGQLDTYKLNIDSTMDKIIGITKVYLDGRFISIRRKETNLGNLIADIMRASTRSDCAIIHSGTFRSDQLYEPGPISLKDLINVFPTPGTMVQLLVSGLVIWKSLENGVSLWPRLEGRFPQISQIHFSFDPNREPGNRIDPETIKIAGKQLNLEAKYRLSTKLFLYKGNDGYSCLKNCPLLMSQDDCPEMITAIENYFQFAFDIDDTN